MTAILREQGAPALIHPSVRQHSFNVEKTAPYIGAELTGYSIAAASQDDDLIAETRRLLLEHKVLFFRDQDITPAQHVAFARRFGELELNPYHASHPDHPELVTLYKDAERRGLENAYHTDVTWRDIPSMGSVLRCLECPAVGGDTIWVNMALAYERLPESRKREIANLRAMHDASHSFGGKATPERRAEIRAQTPPQEHPVVLVHPETGERILYVNQGFTTHFSNFKGEFDIRFGSDHMLQAMSLMRYLFEQAMVPEYQVRLRWQPNTVAFWDNRATQHYAIEDYYPAVRRMNRATIIGTRPAADADATPSQAQPTKELA